MDADDHIDKLLERYLHLLHEYTSLRERLNSLQASMYQNIARANFAAERGVRFGQDYYDERMQASRKIAISMKDDDEGQDIPVFTVTSQQSSTAVTAASDSKDDETSSEEKDIKQEDEAASSQKEKKQKQKDPLRWFGLFLPQTLRQAQTQSIEAIERVVPKLVSVNTQMAQVEIEIRRARKKRAKAEAAVASAKKEKEQEIGTGTEIAA